MVKVLDMSSNYKLRVAVIAITKNGVDIALRIKAKMKDWDVYAQEKFRSIYNNNNNGINWYNEPTASLVARLFNSYNAFVCIFSLGAVVRLIAPYIKDKKSDPAVVVIDDKAKFVISALSGHLGGANDLARLIASILGATPVITTAADVNETIAVDLLGKEFNWVIDDITDANVTMLSAAMVNEEPIGVYQDAGELSCLINRRLPANVTVFKTLDDLMLSGYKALIVTDRIIDDKYSELIKRSVIYRPKSLVVGLGLHYDTSKEEIEKALEQVFKENGLSMKSIRNIATLKRPVEVKGLVEFSKEHGIDVRYYSKEHLASVNVPNPSSIVSMYEGTPSVAEASAILDSNGTLIVEKRKFPPNLTIAVARVKYQS
jgi:cobalt-precorrin 5A hydrolase